MTKEEACGEELTAVPPRMAQFGTNNMGKLEADMWQRGEKISCAAYALKQGSFGYDFILDS